MNGVMIALGYALASYMGLAFYHAKNPTLQWRGPLGLALVWPLMMICIILVVPESPRYLLMAGKEEKAWKVISDLHADPKDPDNDYAKSEFYQMSHQATLDRTLNPSWKQLLTKPSYRKRVVLGTSSIISSLFLFSLYEFSPIAALMGSSGCRASADASAQAPSSHSSANPQPSWSSTTTAPHSIAPLVSGLETS